MHQSLYCFILFAGTPPKIHCFSVIDLDTTAALAIIVFAAILSAVSNKIARVPNQQFAAISFLMLTGLLLGS